MKVRISAAVLHASFAPQRYPMLERLVAGLGSIPVHVECDKYRQGAAETCRKALSYLLRRDDYTHCLVLADDAVPCPDFERQLTGAIQACPAGVMSLYPNSRLAATALSQGCTWLRSIDGLCGVAMLIPRSILDECYEFYLTAFDDKRLARTYEAVPEDTRIAVWAMATKRPIFHPIPGLIDHGSPEESLVGNENHMDRTAQCRLAQPGEVIDWVKGDVMDVGRKYTSSHWRIVTNLTAQAAERYNTRPLAYELAKVPRKEHPDYIEV